MVFSSITFLYVFLPIVFILYYLVPKKIKNLLLLIASLIFYAWGEPVYIFLMIFTSLVNYMQGVLTQKYDNDNLKRKLFLIVTIILNILILGFFKYYGFVIENINALFNIAIPIMKLELPIGISFYTFQALSYSIDVYRREVKAEKNFLNFMTYISLFPQLIAGPIVRYETISEELQNRKVTLEKFTDGFFRFLRGLGKKVLIANNIGMLFTTIQNSDISQLSVFGSWLGIIAFALQIFFDFSGYSDMAIGMGKMLGFTFKENFNYPYISKSITEFWRRWHISLSSWFKDYLYIPLGGSRCKKSKNIRNILIVWMLTGLWHGSAWNFIIWGLYFGVILILEKFVWGKLLEKLPNILKHIYAIFLILIGWVIFAFDNTNQLLIYAKSMFGLNGTAIIDDNAIYNLLNYGLIIVVGVLLSTPIFKVLKDKFEKSDKKILNITCNVFVCIFYIAILILSTAYLVDATYNPFLYFRF